MHLTSYVPASIGRTYSRKDVSRVPLYALLDKAGKGYSTAREAVGALLADPIVAPLLQVSIGAPLLLVQRVLSTASGEAVEYLELRASPDVYRLTRTWDTANEASGVTGY
jgi:GntR family transcriptional regulator